MANSLTPVDVYSFVNALAQQLIGKDALTAYDTSSFVTVGQAVLATGYENTLDALGTMIGRTFIAIRPYTGEFNSIERTYDEFGAISRKISFFSKFAEAATDWNTNISPSQLDDGKTVDHYKINKVYPLEIQFTGLKVYQKSYTRFRKQLKVAFTNETEFAKFVEGMAVEIANEMELMREVENRTLVLNRIGANIQRTTDSQSINLTTAYNAKFGTTLKTKDLLTTNLSDFLKFFVATLKNTSRAMTKLTTNFHVTPTKNNDAGQAMTLLRHTPRDLQRLIVSAPFWTDAESYVFPEIFNDKYLKIENFEAVAYWQTPKAPLAINLKNVNTLNAANGQSTNGAAVNESTVLAILYDRDALSTNYYLDDVVTTPVNAAGDYYNTFYHIARQFRDDQTENACVFYMKDTD